MEIRIQLKKELITEDVMGTLVSEEDSSNIIGEIVSYDMITGVAVCELYEK